MTSSTMAASAAAKLPRALAVGPQKTGTTWIQKYLETRDDVRLPLRPKEVAFFNRRYDRGLEWYAEQFPEGPDLGIEVAPAYFSHPDAPARVAEDLGRIPVLVTLRHPVDRLHSFYLHEKRYGRITAPLRDAVVRHPELLDTGRMVHHIGRWREVVGRENVAILFLEDLKRDPDAFTRGLCDHFGLEHCPVPPEAMGKANAAAVPPHPMVARMGRRTADGLRSAGLHRIVEGAKRLGLSHLFYGKPGKKPTAALSPEDRAWLLDLLEPETAALEQLLGTSRPEWRR